MLLADQGHHLQQGTQFSAVESVVEELHVPGELLFDEGAEQLDLAAGAQIVDPGESVGIPKPLEEHQMLCHPLRRPALRLLGDLGEECERGARHKCCVIAEAGPEEVGNECLCGLTGPLTRQLSINQRKNRYAS